MSQNSLPDASINRRNELEDSNEELEDSANIIIKSRAGTKLLKDKKLTEKSLNHIDRDDI